MHRWVGWDSRAAAMLSSSCEQGEHWAGVTSAGDPEGCHPVLPSPCHTVTVPGGAAQPGWSGV